MSDVHNEHKRIKMKYPNADSELIEEFIEEMPAEAMVAFLKFENDKEGKKCHINTKNMYDIAVGFLETADGMEGAKWNVEDIVRLAGVDFSSKHYTKYDFCYAVNMKYSDEAINIKKYVSDENIIARIMFDNAKSYLEDVDYMGEPSTRAYHNAIKRIKYNYEY